MSMSFRDYDDTTFQNPDAGSKLYNENLLLPWITANFPQAMTSYGRPVFDHYRRVLQDFETWLSADNVHLTSDGYAQDREWIISVIASVLGGVEPAEIVERVAPEPEPEPVENPDLVTTSGTPAYTTGRFGQAMNCGGSFFAKAADSLTPLTDTWGVEWWFRIPTVGASEIGWGESGSAIYFVIRTGGRSPAGVACITYASGGTTREIYGGPRVDDDEWHHGKIQFSSAGADLFVDGLLVDHDDGQIDVSRPRGVGSEFTIGHYGSTTPYVWNGQMDEVRIFDGFEAAAEFPPPTAAYTALPANTVAYWALDGNLTGGIPTP
ncbi:MAG: LamG-like jellyroll fold domain-containing protein [Paracoccus sp. (in: a-proteobacteria)]|uniref:LamG-like jellyroll fold domain-containing protein n=1 Tax=Paracoccus sp. TaxID=267 RepID=UPI004058819E